MTIPERKAAQPAAASALPSAGEIAVLEALAAEGEAIVVRFASGLPAFRTRLLFVDPGRRFLLIKASDDTAANATLLAGPRASLVADRDEWRIEFTAVAPQPAAHEGGKAVRLAFPASVSINRRRMQERAAVPEQTLLRCVGPAGGGASFEASVTDISRGGVGMLQESSRHRMDPGTVLTGYRFERPGRKPVKVDLEVRYTEPATLPDGRPGLKVGYRFLNRSPEMLGLIGEFFRNGL